MQKTFFTYCGLLLGLLLLSGIATSAQAQELDWYSFEDALDIARQTERPVLVDIWAPWCGWCHKMQKESYPKLPNELAQEFVLTRLNRDDHETEHKYKGQKLSSMRLAQKLKAQTVPTVVILSADGNYLFHISGFLSTEKLRSVLLQIQQFTSLR